MIKILVAENAQVLQNKLHRCLPKDSVITVVNSSACVIDMFNQLQPDVAFLDLQSAGTATVELLKKSNYQCDTVLTSDDPSHFMKSDQAGAFDYLPKPYSEQRLQECIARLLSTKQTRIARSQVKPIQRINIQIGNKIWLTNINDVISFKADGRYVKVQTKDREGLLRLTLKNLMIQLDPDVFWQIHRSTIINIEQLDYVEITDTEQMQAQMNNIVTPHVISRSFSHLFKTG